MATFSKLLSAYNKGHEFFLFLAWSAVVAFSLAVSLYSYHRNALENAAGEARTHLELNLEYRAMIAYFGGVYAAVDKVPPNPYLSVPKRDVTTREGDRMTLLNPAYITRLIFERIRERGEEPVINKITSLKPVNPVNAPDAWEKSALNSFEHGAKEAQEIADIGGTPYLRLMRPFLTEQSCLKCHGAQGYKEGSIRGGISIAVPLHSYYSLERQTRKNSILTHGLIWLIGSAGLIVFSKFKEGRGAALRESEWKFRTLSESTNDWEYWVSEKKQIVYISPSCREITGYSREEFLSNPRLLIDIIHPEDRPLYVKHMEDFTASHHEEIEIRIISKDGGLKWLSHMCATLYMQDKFLGKRVSNRDISDRRKAEEEVRRLNQELEKRVTERTAELEASNNELESFNYSISHDLRTPLRAIAGFSRILTEDYANALDEKGQGYLEIIQKKTRDMGQLIDDLLSFSCVGRKKITRSEIDMSGLAKEVSADIALSLPERALTLDIKTAPHALGDASLLRQALHNLFSNAVKFTQGRRDAAIEFGGHAEGDEHVYYVKDNGVGFDMRYANKMFGVFQRLHGADKFEGTGVGLAIVQRIIQMHGGRVWAEGKIDEGATFYFALPTPKSCRLANNRRS